MPSEKQTDDVRVKITAKKIKLWLPPYTVDGQDKGIYSQEMVEELMTETKYDRDVILEALEQLRCFSLAKLASRTKFLSTGQAMLQIKIISSPQQQLPEKINLQTSLEIRGEQLKEELSKRTSCPTSAMKVIAHGKVLQDHFTLQEQNVQHESKLMVLLLNNESILDQENKHVLLHQTRKDAELLSSIDSGDPNTEHYLQVADQTGKALDLPQNERKALAVALTLHQKGRSCAKTSQYSQALLFYLEADEEFQQCSAEILKRVDNYGLLNLDITWCYLCLRSLVHLPNAASRLASCEECLYRSYGENLERLYAIKGGSGKELVLFARLHLLQGIVAYHQNQHERASRLLQQAAKELQELRLDDGKLSQLLEMGYDMRESRLALRGAQGNVAIAVQQIQQQRELKAELHEKEKEERKQKLEQRKLGKTANGEWVNVQSYNMLLAMGYPHSESAQSLQLSDNDVSRAVQILQDERNLLATTSGVPAQDRVAALASLGLDPDSVRRVLGNMDGNVQAAVKNAASNLLSSKQSGNVDGNVQAAVENMASNLLSSEQSGLEETKQASDRLADDIPHEEEEYLDDTMAQEEAFLAEYLAFL